MSNLDKLRDEIDMIDKELVEILEKRMKIAMDVGKYKKENGLPILNKEREKQVLERISNYVEDDNLKKYILELFQSIMDESKELQKNI
ncbi:chorismate mutase [Abyssisolibacter fermentans]|uniref:chorismate mutase n=1 Tax=Abyssisolibacter fermentans TaxID=1766203 RepID=UPI000832DE6F|nr:chorismate mutase [Abyssisolibacter fermentans]